MTQNRENVLSSRSFQNVPRLKVGLWGFQKEVGGFLYSLDHTLVISLAIPKEDKLQSKECLELLRLLNELINKCPQEFEDYSKQCLRYT